MGRGSSQRRVLAGCGTLLGANPYPTYGPMEEENHRDPATSKKVICWLVPWRVMDNKVLVQSHRIHVWYIYLHLIDFYGKVVGKYTNPMDPMGIFGI